MPNLTIEFTGLILHYERVDSSGTNHGKFAVVVADKPTHVPLMIITKNDWDKDVDAWKGTDKGTYYEYDLEGRSVTIENLTTGQVTPDDLFRKNVPSLKEMHGGSHKPYANIADGKPQAGVAAYVGYSGGNVTVSACFEAEAVFDPAITGDPRCFAKTLRFSGSTTTSGTTVTIINTKPDGTTEKVIVKSDAVIRITNSSPSGGNDHHKAFKKLLAPNSSSDPAPELRDLIRTSRRCVNCAAEKALFFGLDERGTEDLVRLFPSLEPVFKTIGGVLGIFIVPRRRGASVECSNSQWP